MDLFKYAIIFEDDTFEVHEIIGTEHDAREAFSESWLQLHHDNPFNKKPVRMEMIRMSDPDDADPIAVYEFHMDGVK